MLLLALLFIDSLSKRIPTLRGKSPMRNGLRLNESHSQRTYRKGNGLAWVNFQDVPAAQVQAIISPHNHRLYSRGKRLYSLSSENSLERGLRPFQSPPVLRIENMSSKTRSFLLYLTPVCELTEQIGSSNHTEGG